MAAMQPIAFYGLKVPPNGLRLDANPGLPASFQITMAALDPTEEVTSGGDAPPRAVLKVVRNIFDVVDEDSEDDDDMDDDDIEAIRRRLGITEDGSDDDSDDVDDEDEEMVNGGPSDPEKQRKAVAEAIAKQLEEDDDDEMELNGLTNGINGKVNKGKGRASDEDDISEDGLSEYVVCTLDPTTHLQQPINIYIGENEECYFRVIGTHSVHLTGNFVISPESIKDDRDDDEEDEEEAQERLQDLLMGMGESDEDDVDDEDDDSEEDELDDLADPRVTEVESDEEEAPQLVKAGTGKKNKNKRAAEEHDSEDVLKKILKVEDKRQNKKLKTNTGEAAPGVTQDKKPEAKETKKEKNAKEAKKEDSSPANGKKVQFAEKLEQGPTPSKTPPSGKRTVSGVQIEDKKVGEGPAAKKGDRVAMRYIGKLKDGKVFDANKKGKPFDFKLGSGEVIKGWEIGVAGMKVGSERRIIVPAKLAYGNKSLPGIPGNSDLTFDLKVISIN